MSWIAGSKLGTHGPNPVPIKSMPEHSLNENKPKLHYALGWIESGREGSGSAHPKLNPTLHGTPPSSIAPHMWGRCGGTLATIHGPI